MTVVAVLTTGFVGTYLYLMWQAGRATWFVYLFTAPFFLISAGLGYWGVRGLIRLVLFGQWYIEVLRPGVLGQTMEVRLFPKRDVMPVSEIVCHLCCLQSNSIDTGRSRSANIKTLWETSWNVTSPAILKEVGLSLSLPLRERSSAPSVPTVGGSPTFKWQLTVNVPMQGASDQPMFDVPIAGSTQIQYQLKPG